MQCYGVRGRRGIVTGPWDVQLPQQLSCAISTVSHVCAEWEAYLARHIGGWGEGGRGKVVEKERVRDERPKVAGVILVVILPLKRPFCLVETLSVAGLTLCVHVLLARTPLTTSKPISKLCFRMVQ